MPAVDGSGVFEQRAVDEVATVLLDDIQQAKAELEFGNELEVRQIDVAAHSDFEVDVEGLESQGIVLAGCEVHHRIDAGYEIGAKVVVARRSKLQVNGNRDVGALEDLSAVGSALLLVVDGMLLSEMDGRRKAQGQVFVQAEVAQHAYGEARTVVVYLRIPLFTRLRVDVAIVLELEVLHMKTKQEPIVKLPLVDVRAVLHPLLLCCQAQSKEK